MYRILYWNYIIFYNGNDFIVTFIYESSVLL